MVKIHYLLLAVLLLGSSTLTQGRKLAQEEAAVTASSVEVAPTAVVASMAVSDADEAQAQTVSAAAISTSGVPAQFKNLLDEHNRYRALHNAPALTWSTTLAASAATYAATCPIGGASNNALKGQGENIWLRKMPRTGDSRIISYFQNSSINFATYTWWRGLSSLVLQNETSVEYQQVVWKAATQIGCALQTCVDYGQRLIIVCRYNKRISQAEVQYNVQPLSATHTLPAGFEFTATKNNLPGATGANVNCLTSANKQYKLCMQTDGQLVLTNTRTNKKIWGTNIIYTLVDPNNDPGAPGAQTVVMGQEGVLAVYPTDGEGAYTGGPNWYSISPGGTVQERVLRGPARLVVEDTGSVRIYSVSNDVIWTN